MKTRIINLIIFWAAIIAALWAVGASSNVTHNDVSRVKTVTMSE